MEKVTSTNQTKPLQVNPFVLSQPMGATLAWLGVNKCMPLMHGALGCASFTKVFFTRHFCEPIAIQTTTVDDITAVLDGGDYSVAEAITNITAKVTPSLIGLNSTGLTETKGDDLRRVTHHIDIPLVYAHTSDYSGGLESGWAIATRAMIEQLVAEQSELIANKVVVLPHVSLQPIEVEKIKDFISAFGFEVYALPDLSTSLDGYLGEKQGALSGGGIEVDDIRKLANSATVISIGESMARSAKALQEKNPQITHLHFDHLNGLTATDTLVEKLLEIGQVSMPPAAIVRWRQRLQDAMIDSHFSLGQTTFAVALEPDQGIGVISALQEAGASFSGFISSVRAKHLATLSGVETRVGDMEDLEALHPNTDLFISNFHAERIAHRYGKGHLVRGFPNWEQVGNALKNDVLYEGGCYLLFEAANLATEHRST